MAASPRNNLPSLSFCEYEATNDAPATGDTESVYKRYLRSERN
uniref:Uncharacterized protein n=1 Tax=Tetraselmis sp. GSL018 TaxID=582737 RepID=A0A061REK0_9CHLO